MIGILSAVTSFLFMTKIGRIILGAVAVLFIGWGLHYSGYRKGNDAATAKCVAAEQQRKIEIADRDRRIQMMAEQLDQEKARAIELEREQDDAIQKQLAEKLAQRPVHEQCRATQSDLDELR